MFVGSWDQKFLSRFLFLFILAGQVIACPLSAADSADDIPKDAQTIVVPIHRKDLKNIPPNQLPTELRDDLNAKPPSDVLQGSQNSGFDYVLILTRGLINGTSIAAGYILTMHADPALAAIPGLLGLGMSASLQIFHPAKSHWIKHKSKPKTWYDVKNFFIVSETEKASFVESFFVKEFSIDIVYLNVVQVASALAGIQPDYISWRPFASAGMSLFSDGVWAFFIADITERLVEKYPQKAKTLWRLSKIAATGVSVISTFASAMFLMNKEWAPLILVGLGASGGAALAVTSNPARKFYERIGSSAAMKSVSSCALRLRRLIARKT